jgi:hypothetical protein
MLFGSGKPAGVPQAVNSPTYAHAIVTTKEFSLNFPPDLQLPARFGRSFRDSKTAMNWALARPAVRSSPVVVYNWAVSHCFGMV